MMISDKARVKVSRLMQGHQEWLNKWERRSGIGVEMISPRGKRMTCSAYYFEVTKHLNSTIDKIAKVVKEDGAVTIKPASGKANTQTKAE